MRGGVSEAGGGQASLDDDVITAATLARGGQATLDDDAITTAGLTDTAGTPTDVLLAASAVSVDPTVTATMTTATTGTVGVLRVTTTLTT
ncbi:hypothetical protein, partial [Streptomyces sp. NPDC002550]